MKGSLKCNHTELFSNTIILIFVNDQLYLVILTEYALHRWAFHVHVTSYWGITLHFLFHGNHHKYPMDGERLVFPPVPASLLVGAVYASLTNMMSQEQALPLFAGMGYGYVLYDCTHCALHHLLGHAGGGSSALLRIPMARNFLEELRRRHAHHHFRDHGSGYGISSTLFDALLGTYAGM